MLDWIIVGGGIHGTYLSNHLLKSGRTANENLMVIDPHDQPLAFLDIGAGALIRYAKTRAQGKSEFYSRFRRPSLALFNSHCSHVVVTEKLEEVRLKARATSVKMTAGHYVVDTTAGAFAAKNIVLSLGHDCISTPLWASELLETNAPIAHIFSSQFQRVCARDWTKAVVIGGGISAAQLALSLAKKRPGSVSLLHARNLKTSQFDADPCWLDKRCLKLLTRENDFARRRRIVDHARNWGTFPEDVRRHLDSVLQDGSLQCIENSVLSAAGDASQVKLCLLDGTVIEADLVILATGFERCLPGGDFLKTVIDNLSLPCAPCGFPLTDKDLRWQKNFFVTGALAELQVGPISRNIVGARLASELIASADIPRKHRPRELSYYYFGKRRSG
jgi:hypothetical protein